MTHPKIHDTFNLLPLAVCSTAFPSRGDEGEEVRHFCQDHSKILEEIHRQEEV